jgi:hypothetical protein
VPRIPFLKLGDSTRFFKAFVYMHRIKRRAVCTMMNSFFYFPIQVGLFTKGHRPGRCKTHCYARLTESQTPPSNASWRSKQTQFHGSLGKAPAQAPTLQTVGTSPDDDEMPRISWRGDDAFFIVSSLSPVSYSSRPRALLVYDTPGRAAVRVQGGPGPGIRDHMAAVRQPHRWHAAVRIRGRRCRHDVVFFERNGLRHGEFAVRV